MKAMILAAGKGTRVRPLTHSLPKPMIPILGKPVMEYLVEELSRHGFNQIMVNTAHLANHLENYFSDGRRWGVEIGYSFEGQIRDGEVIAQPVGSAGGMRRIQDFGGFFDDTFLVVCGDALIDLDLTAAVRRHWQSGAAASMVVAHVPPSEVSNYGVVECDSNRRITGFQEKPSVDEARSDLVNTGIYFFEPEVLDLIPKGCEYDIGSQLFPDILAAGLPFNAIDIPFNWIDIGRLSDYWDANQRLMLGHLNYIRMPGTEMYPGVWCGLNVKVDWDNVRIEGPVYIGAGSNIRSGAEILGPTWIGHGCVIEGGAKVRRSILFEYSRLGSRANVDEAVIFGRNCVDKEGQSIHDGDLELDWVSDSRDAPTDS
ncbi:MAG: mannose-1-phosphate guanylyltransferase [marine bacterium B5-7]|nr:MAG: mannose-1-phosphate guanylyltransferase [marine bacterium B5-7]